LLFRNSSRSPHGNNRAALRQFLSRFKQQGSFSRSLFTAPRLHQFPLISSKIEGAGAPLGAIGLPVPPYGGGRFAALQHGDFLTQRPQLPADRRPFGRRRSACLQLSTGLSPAAPMHVQPLQGGGSYCPRTATLGLPVSCLRNTTAGAAPAPLQERL